MVEEVFKPKEKKDPRHCSHPRINRVLDLLGILFIFPAVALLMTVSIFLSEQSLKYRKESVRW